MLTITTYDWVPEKPRGWVRDLRVRWACEEAGLPYRVDTVPLKPKSAAHLARQPFGQVPMLRDGNLSLFESGAIVMHLAEKSDVLMPADAAGRADTICWMFAALNSLEPAELYRQYVTMFDPVPEAQPHAEAALDDRLKPLEDAFADRQFAAAGRFTAADILLGDVLRASGAGGRLKGYPRLSDYVARMTARPAFAKAHADQLAHFAAATPPVGAPA